MKHGKKPTKKQCIMLSKHKLDPKKWLIVRDSPDCLEIVNRYSGLTRRLNRKYE